MTGRSPSTSTSPTTSPPACRYFFVAVLTLSFLLLMVVFRSLLVPLKAVIMNLLSIGAAYGVSSPCSSGAGSATSPTCSRHRSRHGSR